MSTNPEIPGTFYLTRGQEPPTFQLAVTVGQGHPKERNGMPCFYYWGDALPTGSYKHPVQKYEFGCSLQDQKELDANFHRMNSRGVPVPIVKDHKETADNTLGYIVDSKPGKLLYQFIGEKNRDTGLVNQVSVRIDKNYEDGLGNVYSRAIRHVAATPMPVIPGQKGFIAASSAQASEPIVLELSAGPNTGDILMNAQQLSAAKELLGDSGKDLTAENAIDRVLAHCKTMKPASEIVALSAAVAAKNAELVESKKLLGQKEEKIVELSRQISGGSPKEPDMELMVRCAKLDQREIELSVSEGDMPAVIAKEVIPLLKKDGNPNVFMLSRNADLDKSPVEWLLSLFNGKKLGTKNGARSGVQVLDRTTPDAKGDGGAGGSSNLADDPQFIMMKNQIASLSPSTK